MDDSIYFILICNKASKRYYLLRTSYVNEFKQIYKYKHNRDYELIIFGATYPERICRVAVIRSLRARGYKFRRCLLNDFLIHNKSNYFNRTLK